MNNDNITLGKVTLLAGLPGSGKTKLLDELTAREFDADIELPQNERHWNFALRMDRTWFPVPKGEGGLSAAIDRHMREIYGSSPEKLRCAGVVEPIVAALLRATPGSLVSVEKPEALQHPRTVARLAQLMVEAAANGVHILVETDSDVVLDGFRIAVRSGSIPADEFKIYYLGWNGSPPRQISVSPRGAIEEWPEGFFNQKDVDWEKLFEV